MSKTQRARMGPGKEIKQRGSSEVEKKGWLEWLLRIIGPIAWLLAKLADRLLIRMGH